MTPEEYRARYGLPKDYPMTAPAYSERRSALAMATGLGQQRRKREVATETDAPTNVMEQAAASGEEQTSIEPPSPRKRGRPARKKVAEAA